MTLTDPDENHFDVPYGWGSVRAGERVGDEPPTLTWWSGVTEYVDAFAVSGYDMVDALLPMVDENYSMIEYRDKPLDVLERIPTDEALDGLLVRATDRPGVPAAVERAAARFPRRAAKLMLARREDPMVALLLARHLQAHPELSVAGSKRVPDAAKVPALLASPPWTRTPPRPVKVAAPDDVPSIHWLPGERETWSIPYLLDYYDPPGPFGPLSVRYVSFGPEGEVRPQLPYWPAEHQSYYLTTPKVIVARFELDALVPMMRLARAKPVLGGPLVLPYRSGELARLMAGWLASSRAMRPLAAQWFERHGAAAVTHLLPIALGAKPAERRTTSLALSRLDPAVVRTAAADLGCVDATEDLLARDPLDLLPGTVPSVPSWLDLDVLPQVLLRGRRRALPREATAALVRLIAMSELDAPYEGLRAVADELDPDRLAEFAWSLFLAWNVVERPSKDVWALNSLGYFGTSATADLLAPMVRRWPHEGAAARGKRGVDVLAAMDNDTALRYLSALARNARSIPLRKHAGVVLDRVAVDRGMLPEQLDDLLAPDLDLGHVVTYRGVDRTIELAADGTLVLRAADGTTVGPLPKATSKDEKPITSDWTRRRKQGRAAIADQVRRLEEAMIVQRRWDATGFTSSIVAHPLLGRLARRLVWTVGGTTATVDVLGDLVDPSGRLIKVSGWIQLAHPASSDLGSWRDAFADVVQPFAQLDRSVPDGDPSIAWGRTVAVPTLYSLLRRGWHWGGTGPAARRHSMIRSFGAQGEVMLRLEPGVFANGRPADEPEQTIEGLTLASPVHGELALFTDLPRAARAELLLDLESLHPRGDDTDR